MFLRLCLLLSFAFVIMASSDKPQYDLSQSAALFEKYVQDYSKEYKDEADRQVHYEAFTKSLQKINRLNADSSSATYGLNKFADWTEEEMKQLRGFKKN